ncbi:MAG: NUDIX domain-containing protein [Promethearchaeota archaeon]
MRRKKVISAFMIRYNGDKLEFLLIKRAEMSYNWHWITGGVEKGEIRLEGAKRELREEIGYHPALIIPFSVPQELYKDLEEEDLNLWVKQGQSLRKLHNIMKKHKMYYFQIRIDELQDPILDPTEHTDWKWCDYETACKSIMWLNEKKILTCVNNYLIENPLK